MFTNIWFWTFVVIGLILLFWPEIYLRGAEYIRQEDLAKISPDYDSLNRLYLSGGAISLAVTLLFLFSGFEFP